MPAATLEIRREGRRYGDRLRAYRVVVDGERLGTVKRGETQGFEVEPGHHSVKLHLDWCRSRPARADAPD